MELKTLPRYVIGCNYWSFASGTEMWRQFDADSIDADFASLSANGTDTLRIFPNWRDFQPITTIDGFHDKAGAYRFDDGSADGQPLPNPNGLDPVMLDRMKTVCQLAYKHRISLVISIVTGWMSGRMFIPTAFKRKNPIADPEVLRWEHRYVTGLVEYIKDEPAILAWDLGNECNCMGEAADSHVAYLWTLTISSAIRLADNTRPVLSGMHSLTVSDNDGWTMIDQGELTDCLTTHPYPGSPTIGANVTPSDSYRTLLLPTAQTVLYAAISKKPAMIEEQGTLNRIYANDNMAAFAAKANFASCWANGGKGYLWWCAYDQKSLNFAPYSLSMRELGCFDENRQPKSVAVAMTEFSERLAQIGRKINENDITVENSGSTAAEWANSHPCITPETDAVCVLTMGQNPWQVAAMTYLIAKQASMNLTFAYHTAPIPTAPIYMLPSLKGWTTIYKNTYHELLRRVREEGATLYVSWDGGALELFEEVYGVRSLGQYHQTGSEQGDFRFGDEETKLSWGVGGLALKLENVSADVIGKTADDRPVFIRKNYGKGKVFFLAFGIEAILWNQPTAFEGGTPYRAIYQYLLSESNVDKTIRSNNPMIGVTRFSVGETKYAAIVNYSPKTEQLSLYGDAAQNAEPLLGDKKTLTAGEFTVIKLSERTKVV